MEEAHPEAAALLAAAGWKPHDPWGVYTRGTLVMGFSPDGMHFDVKNWAADVHGPDYPDDPVEAAQWLVSLRAVKFTTEATLDPVALQSEEVENLQDESNGETGEASDGGSGVLSGSSDAVSDSPELDGSESLDAGGGELAPLQTEDYPIDADFTEGEDLGSELLDVELEGDDFAELNRRADAALLDAPLPEDFAPEDFAHEPEPEAPQDRFIGLDDLDRVRSLRIGDVATEALRLTTLIERAVSEQEGEFSNIQAYVVSNLDKHTGAFTPQDDASRATYGRFLELSSARSKIAKIDARRKDATAFLIAAGRDDVVSFDVRAAFA